MGWSSGNEVFDPVATKMQELGASDEVKTEVLTVLIHELQMRDWDTEGESLDQFEDDPAIVEAFRRNRVVVKCDEKATVDGVNLWCERERGPRGHQGGQHDDYGRTWPVAKEPA
ncbi:MAG: hypothetical protein JWM19_899 [Actinomycetia bacterium]|nr:hypothetical protein [Actinomycetes bacterium]